MNKEEALEEFFKSFKIALNTAVLYPKTHPSFKRPLEDLKEKADLLFQFSNPINIGFSTTSLFVEGEPWDKLKFSEEIARLFHSRKVKGIEIRKGATVEEFVSFFSAVSLRPREILRTGGLKRLLEKEGLANFNLYELDYSQFLSSEGDEIKDIWGYLLQEAVEEKNLAKLNELIRNFEGITNKISLKDFLEDEQLKSSIKNFLKFIKESKQEDYIKCNQAIFKFVLKEKNIPEDDNLEKIKLFFQDLSYEGLSDILSESIKEERESVELNFQLLFKIFDEKKHSEVAKSLAKKLESDERIGINPKTRSKIKNLFSIWDSSSISEIYRNILQSILENVSFKEALAFDRHLLQMNYRYALLNLLSEEHDEQRIEIIIKNLLTEWPNIVKENDSGYIKNLLMVLTNREKDEPYLVDVFFNFEKIISNFVEEIIWQAQEPSLDLDYFVDTLRLSSGEVNYYLDKIFKEEKVSPYALKLFFKFFPDETQNFCSALEEKRSDIDFIAGIVNNLNPLEYKIAMEVYKHIFGFSNEIIKAEVLKAMQGLPEFDPDFLFSILSKISVVLKREALIILLRDDAAKKKAIELLLSVPSPLGIRNKIILENMSIIEELGLKDARGYVSSLAKKRFFWNAGIRAKARGILEIWKNGEH